MGEKRRHRAGPGRKEVTPTEALEALCDEFGGASASTIDGFGEMVLAEFLSKYEVREKEIG